MAKGKGIPAGAHAHTDRELERTARHDAEQQQGRVNVRSKHDQPNRSENDGGHSNAQKDLPALRRSDEL